MSTENFKKAIDILTSDQFDARAIVIELAKNHPAIFVKLASSGSKVELFEQWHLDVVRHASVGELVKAIKLTRERTGLGLKEAKDIVDDARNQMANNGVPGVQMYSPERVVHNNIDVVAAIVAAGRTTKF